jgi:ketosteroid isomerase-like protein
LALALLLRPGAAAAASAEQTAAAVGAVDREFARRAGEEGAAAALRDYMDPEQGLLFDGAAKPARGADAIFAAAGTLVHPGQALTWIPLSAWGSKGGDMGVTSGDWALRGKTPPTLLATGRYVTVWHKDKAGKWKGLIDIGETDPKPVPNLASHP